MASATANTIAMPKFSSTAVLMTAMMSSFWVAFSPLSSTTSKFGASSGYVGVYAHVNVTPTWFSVAPPWDGSNCNENDFGSSPVTGQKKGGVR